MSDVLLRAPRASDAARIAILLDQLGHPAPANDVPRRVAAIERHPDAEMWVAELEGRVVGFATALIVAALHMDGPVAQLTSLVVDESVRGRGVGAVLVAEAERWSRDRGAIRLSLTSALHRTPAHAFYEHLGYAKTGVRLAKDLG